MARYTCRLCYYSWEKKLWRQSVCPSCGRRGYVKKEKWKIWKLIEDIIDIFT